MFIQNLITKVATRRGFAILTESDWLILTDYITIMKPSAEALDILQGDKHACLGYLLPTVYAVKRRVSSSMLNTHHGEKMRDALLKSLLDRFGEMMEVNEQNMYLYLATASHPLFKLEWLHNHESEIVKRWFYDAVKKQTNPTQTSSTAQESQDDFFYRYSAVTSVSSQNVEIEGYLSNPSKSIDILHQYPSIKELFIAHNTTLSSTGVIERMFSNASLIFQPRRNRLSSSNFEKAMFIKKNRAPLIQIRK